MSKKNSDRRSQKRRAARRADRRTRIAGTDLSVARLTKYAAALRHDRPGYAAAASLRRQPLDTMVAAIERYPALGGTAPFPTNLNSIADSFRLPTPESLDSALRWTCATLLHHSKRINSFLEDVACYERALLSGDLGHAETLVSRVEAAFGVSLWLTAARLQTAALAGGLSRLRETAKQLTDTTENGFAKLYVDLISEKLEPNASPQKAKESLDNLCSRLHANYVSDDNRLFIEYFRFRVDSLALELPSNPADVLHRESANPIIDQYASYLRLLQLLAVEPSLGQNATLRQCIARLGAKITDVRLDLLHTYLAMPPSRLQLPPPPDLVRTLEAYTRGNYEEALQSSAAEIERGSSALEYYEICAKSLLYSARTPNQSGIRQSTLSWRVLGALYDLLQSGSAASTAAWLLRGCGLAIEGSRFASQLTAFALSRDPVEAKPRARRMQMLNAATPTPQFAEVLPSAPQRERFLSSLDPAWTDTSTRSLFSASKQPSSIDSLRAQKYRARHLMDAHDYPGAIEAYSAAMRSAEGRMPIARELEDELCTAYVQSGRTCDAVELLVSSHAARCDLTPDARLTRLLAARGRADFQGLFARLAWPLASYLAASPDGEPPAAARRRIFGAYDDFLCAMRKDRPTELELSMFHGTPERRQLLMFLRWVCVPEIMDSSLTFSTADEVERERIAVCQQLLQLAPEHSDADSQEISRRTQALMLRRALKYLGDSKIYVDTDGIAKSLGRRFHANFERLVALAGLPPLLRKSFVIKGFDRGSQQPHVVVIDLAQDQFRDLFDHIKSRFISSNEFGLDSYLSVRIRHGTLSAQLRNSFEQEKLITQRNSVTGQYEPNTLWLDTLVPGPTAEGRQECSEAFNKLARAVDEAIDDVKQNWIQIRSPSKPSGMFDFDYDDKAIARLYAQIGQLGDVSAFVSKCIAELWRRTEENLRQVNNRMDAELTQRLLASLDELEAEASAMVADGRPATFQRAIARCRTEIGRDLSTIRAWFRRPNETAAPDFTLDLLGETAVEIVRNCFPRISFTPAVALPSNCEIKGAFFYAFVDVLFILLGNTVRHSGAPSPKVQVRAGIVGGVLEFSVTNVLTHEVAAKMDHRRMAEIQALVAGTKGTGDIVRAEGGSGLVKLKKLLAYDLKRGGEASIGLRILEGDVFEVTIKMPKEGLVK